MNGEFDYLVYIGRFQPFHNAHLEIVRRALTKAGRVIVVLGSARRARNIRHPFSDGERERMIAASVRDADAAGMARLVFCPVRDYYDDDKWGAAVKAAVAEVTRGRAARIGLIGHHKDASTYYLDAFPDWPLVHEANHAGLCATDVREALFAGRDEAAWARVAECVPPAALAFLREFRRTPEFAALAEEYAEIEAYRAAWAAAPYPPIFVTVDAVVRCRGHVLLIRRGGHPGRGQWALPGGFVEQDETLQQGAIRELLEESGLAVPLPALRGALKGSAVFDHPNRSVRGRIITHAFFFDLPHAEFPALAAADDAADARWFPVGEVAGMETQIFEDHLHVMARFMEVW